jgi:DnaJ-domain-containing protein 1
LFSITPMQSVRVVVAPASQLNCIKCKEILAGELAPHLCVACGFPQPVQSYESLFTALGAPNKFSQDLGAVEKRFYQLSRFLHPDRFSSANVEAKVASMERMSFLNQAYQTLRNSERLRGYVLSLEGVKVLDESTNAPMELAEVWFGLQDVLMEDPGGAKSKLAEFLASLHAAQLVEERAIIELEHAYDIKPDRAYLMQMAERIRTQGYLKSLERDVTKRLEGGGKF